MGGEVYLGTRRIFGGGAPGAEPDADRRRLAARFADPAQIVRAFEGAMERGATAIVTVSHPNLFAALRRMGRSAPPVIPVVPNIQGFMREAVEHGIIGAGTRRVRRMGIGPLVGLGLRSVARTPMILSRDFPTLLRCFIEMELAEFAAAARTGGGGSGRDGGAAWRRPLLQAQFTDLALAMNNPRIVQAFTRALGRGAGGDIYKPSAGPAGADGGAAGADRGDADAPRGGFATANPDALIPRLAEWGVRPDALLAPPGRLAGTDAADSGCGGSPPRLIADLSGQPVPPKSGRANSPASACVRDDDEMLFGAVGAASPLPHTP